MDPYVRCSQTGLSRTLLASARIQVERDELFKKPAQFFEGTTRFRVYTVMSCRKEDVTVVIRANVASLTCIEVLRNPRPTSRFGTEVLPRLWYHALLVPNSVPASHWRGVSMISSRLKSNPFLHQTRLPRIHVREFCEEVQGYCGVQGDLPHV